MGKYSKLFYQILTGLFIVDVIFKLMDLSMMGMFLKDFIEVSDVMNDSIFYLPVLDLILVTILELVLIFGLLKMKRFVPSLMVILLGWRVGYYIYFNILWMSFLKLEYELIGLGVLIAIGGSIVVKTLKDREYFQT